MKHIPLVLLAGLVTTSPAFADPAPADPTLRSGAFVGAMPVTTTFYGAINEGGQFPTSRSVLALGAHAGYDWRVSSGVSLVVDGDLSLPWAYNDYYDEHSGMALLRGRLGVRLHMDSEAMDSYLVASLGGTGIATRGETFIGLHSLIALGSVIPVTKNAGVYAQGGVHLGVLNDDYGLSVVYGIDLMAGWHMYL